MDTIPPAIYIVTVIVVSLTSFFWHDVQFKHVLTIEGHLFRSAAIKYFGNKIFSIANFDDLSSNPIKHTVNWLYNSTTCSRYFSSTRVNKMKPSLLLSPSTLLLHSLLSSFKLRPSQTVKEKTSLTLLAGFSQGAFRDRRM